jgi:hypothetical protein
MAAPARRHSSSFKGSTAGTEDEYGRVMPIASMAEAMVLAVYMPPQAPCARAGVQRTTILAFFLADGAGEVGAVALEGRDDVQHLAAANGRA